MKPSSIQQACYTLAILLGMGCLVLGPVIKSSRPHFLLDHVLTPEQLRDQSLRERTLAQLKQNENLDWTLPSIGGLLLIAVGTVGLSAQIIASRFPRIAKQP
jgi:hypothetical protein